ncbi:hypothetical protein [Zavarzinella formosa]|uniref:hypothetical protein n=1 Tax=Zavarzinella formosa TaxID=360055 RepID=UPI00031EA5D0|nr:hypothetical protein [Zavarzinella formosa]
MKITTLIELLGMFPGSTEVYVQTCEGDLLSPLERKNLWLTEAWIDERSKTLEAPKLVITAFINGRERIEHKNQHSGVLVKHVDKETAA